MAKFLKVRGSTPAHLLMGRSGIQPPRANQPPANSVFFSNEGSNTTGDGSASNPWETWNFAHTNCPVGFTVVALAGLYDTPLVVAYWYPPTGFARDVSNWRAKTATFRLAIAGARLFFVGTRYNSGSYTFSNLIADCTDGAGTTLAGKGFDIGNNDLYANLTIDNVTVIAPGAQAINSAKRSGIVTISNCRFEYDDLDTFVVGGANHANTGTAVWNVVNNRFNNTITTLVNSGLIGGVATVAQALQYTYNVTGNDITLDIPVGTGGYKVISPSSAALSTVSDNRITVTSAATTQLDVIIAQSDVGTPSPQVNITGNVVRMYAQNGFGISLGEPSSDNYIENGLMENNTVIGQYYPANTPHLFDVGRCEVADRYICRNNIASTGFVGYLVSEGGGSAASLTEDNLAYDCYGPSYYAKGNTNATIQNNRAVLSDTHTQRNFGVLHATSQTGVNVQTLFSANVVTVQDISKLTGSLAGFSAGNTATFLGNTYYLPDTTDLLTELLFSVNSGVANTLYADWLLESTVFSDEIILLPQEDIDEIVAAAAAEVQASL